ncbi:MAG: replication-associated recombination protein A [Candidatus Sumerlaeaceae bacterium]|nr:replication-associated recombination protein A [Candidatus Sumerlaeaceae bacterium]
MDFFEDPESADGKPSDAAPLAERMRPRTLEEFTGQGEIAGKGGALRRLIEEDALRSLIFWGPPGTGKTTLASIIARRTKAEFVSLSAVTSGIKDVKGVMERARLNLARHNRRTILFVDEIHRFNKAQQDAFLPYVEDGSIVLIGATTENPSFSVISALMSRCKVFVLKQLKATDLKTILAAAVNDPKRGLASKAISVPEPVLEKIASLCDGDARRALNLLEFAVELTAPNESGVRDVNEESLKLVLQRQHLFYDKTGEEHYNIISALHKAMRGRDAQAAVYWTTRMLQSGEDPLYLARRMVRFASEDVGNADPQALVVAMAAREAFRALGSPEGDLALIQCAVYLATAPKSNALYVAEGLARKEIESTGSLPVPFHIRNAPTGFMKGLGYGDGYQYEHDKPGAFSGQEFLPDGVETREFYRPGPFGFEKEIAKRMEWWAKKKSESDRNKD